MNSRRYEPDAWAIKAAPTFLKMIGVQNGDEMLAAIGLDCLFTELPDGRPRQKDRRPQLRKALKAIEYLYPFASPFGALDRRSKEVIARHLFILEEEFAEQRGPDFEPLSVSGTLRFEVWRLELHLAALAKAIELEIADEDRDAKERARRPREDWKREAMFACVWLAYQLRLRAGLPDPVPNLANGVLGELCGFALVELKVAEATAEKYARTAVALVGKVRKGLLSDKDRRFLCDVRDEWCNGELIGELADIVDPGHSDVEDPAENRDAPLWDLRTRTGL